MKVPLLEFDAIVLGGGPAGCSCASWLDMLGLRCALVERRDRLGGLQNDSPYVNGWLPVVPRGWTGQQVAQALAQDMAARSVDVRTGRDAQRIERVTDGFHVLLADGRLKARSLVLATGVEPRSGDLMAGPRVLVGPGSQVAATDFSGQRVAVLGGGDNAFENYLYVMQRGARTATIFARSIRARRAFVSQVPGPDVRRGVPHIDTAAMTVDGEPFDLILVMYGWQARLPELVGERPLLDAAGFVVTDAHCRAGPDLYAIGEVTRRAHPCCLTAMADGVVAAKAIQERLDDLAASPGKGAGAAGLRLLQDNPA